MIKLRIFSGILTAALVASWATSGHADDKKDTKGSSDARQGAAQPQGQKAKGQKQQQGQKAKSATQGEGKAKQGQQAERDDGEGIFGETDITAAPIAVGAEAPEPVRINMPLLVTGAAAFGAAYIPSLVVGITSDRDADRPLLAPVVGPWITLGQGRECDELPCSQEGLDTILVITSGVLQGAGAIAAAASLFIPPGSREAIRTAEPKVHVLPISMGRAGAGIGAAGTF